MKILVHDYAGHPFQVQLSREFAKRGYEILHLYSASIQTPQGNLIKNIEDPDNFKIKGVKLGEEINKYSFIKRYFQEKKYAKILVKEIEKFKPDVIISSNTPIHIQKYIVEYSKKNKSKFIFWVQDLYGVAVDKLLRKKFLLPGILIGKYFKKLEKEVLINSDKIVLITEDFLPIMKTFGINLQKCTVIHNWAPIDEIPIFPKNNDWAKKYNFEKSINIIYSGTLGLKHNPELLLTLAQHFKENKNIKIIVISEGPGADFLKERKMKLNLDNLIILPFQPFKDLPKVLASADILVAILEPDAGIFSVPSKVLTYHCAGKPILLAVPEENLSAKIVKEYKTGLTVNPNYIENFLKASEKLIYDEKLRITYGKNARDYAEHYFDIKNIANKFEKIIN